MRFNVLLFFETKVVIFGTWRESVTSVLSSPLPFVLELPDALAQYCGIPVALVLKVVSVSIKSSFECICCESTIPR